MTYGFGKSVRPYISLEKKAQHHPKTYLSIRNLFIDFTHNDSSFPN